MKIKLASVYVDDQVKALKFYTEVLGFVKKADATAAGYRWLTVVSPEELDGAQLQLAPNNISAARSYQEAMYKEKNPATMFFVDDMQGEYERLKILGVKITTKPTETPGSTFIVFDDTCGNLIKCTQMG
jgi:predicted enzyme related to lactoylglutathione lyase